MGQTKPEQTPWRDRWGNVHMPLAWREPHACESCGRPVIQDKRGPQIIACSAKCRRQIYTARQRWQRAPVDYVVCGAVLARKAEGRALLLAGL
jgi:hypothetical protein